MVKRTARILLVILGFAIFMAAQENNSSKMTGTICDQKCVKQDAGKAACDQTCTEKSGEAVFLDDQGKSWKVANPAVCKGHMGKKVKIQCKKMEEPDTLEILKIYG